VFTTPRDRTAADRWPDPSAVGRTPAVARPALDHAVHAAFASGLNRTLLVCGVAGLRGAAIVAVFVRSPRATAEPAPIPAEVEVEVEVA
jgi:hypothetical protein